MYIYTSAATALMIAISTLQASAQSLPVTAVDLASFYNRQYRRADRQIRKDANVLLNHELYHGQTVHATSTTASSTISSTQSRPASSFNPAILNHELYRAGAVTEPSTTSEVAASTTTQSVSAPKVDSATWNSQTKAACESALHNLNGKASNPAGVAVCYNLPELNNSTGAFQVDLRLYRVAAPAQGWKTVFDQTVNVALYYPGATVASQDTNKRRRDDRMPIWNQIESVEALHLERRTDDGKPPQILQAFRLMGQINNNMMGEMANQ